ncbi:hypothetical protein Tco_0703133 [Tanacetum coccineum]|uniref:Uncharacterized protein n=1 Tax=Tanacetum coccineum TaxID=301880 RepID=A0ABQ4XYS4_9ASTR
MDFSLARQYVADILKKFDFAIVKTTSTPMEPNKALIKDEEADSVDVHLYRSMIGSMIYLKGQPKLGLWYPRDSPFDLEAFFDSDIIAGASLDWFFHNRMVLILAREEAKTAQDKVITRLNLRVKRLEKKRKKIRVVVKKGGSTVDQVSTARPEVSDASVPVNDSAATPSTPPTTITIFGDEDLTIAQTLVKMRSEKAKEKEKGVVLIDKEEPPRLNRSTTTLQPLPTIDPKDKELDSRLHEEEVSRVGQVHKKRQKQEEATNAALLKKVQKLYEREKKWIDDFKPIDDDSQQQAESTKKRPRADSEEESSKKQKLEEDNNAKKEELRDSMDVVLRDDVAIDVDSFGGPQKYSID